MDYFATDMKLGHMLPHEMVTLTNCMRACEDLAFMGDMNLSKNSSSLRRLLIVMSLLHILQNIIITVLIRIRNLLQVAPVSLWIIKVSDIILSFSDIITNETGTILYLNLKLLLTEGNSSKVSFLQGFYETMYKLAVTIHIIICNTVHVPVPLK